MCAQNTEDPQCVPPSSDSQGDPSEARELMSRLQYSEERYQIAAGYSSEIILEYSVENDSIFHVTERVTAVYGVPRSIEHAPDYLVRCGAVQPESARDFLDLFRKIRQGERQVSCALKTRTATGDILWNDLFFTTVFDDSDHPTRAIGVLKDVTAQRQAELQYQSELLHRESMGRDALLYYEADLTHHRMLSGLEGVLSQLNLPYTDRYEDALEILTTHFVDTEDRPLLCATYSPEYLMNQHAAGNDKIEREYRRISPDGSTSWVRSTGYLSEDKERGIIHLYYYVNDINEAKERELKLQAMAERDQLTGLYNKVTTELQIQQSIAETQAAGGCDALFIVDLDNFKLINDALGHAFGDAVLSATAQRLQALCRAGDIAGRVGGDEFIIYMRGLPDAATAERRAESICRMFHTGCSQTLKTAAVTGTVGVSLMPDHGTSFRELYLNADAALYAAKGQGKNTWNLYRPEVERSARLRPDMEGDLGKRFEDNIIEYVFRILYEAQDLHQAIAGVLALLAGHYQFSRVYLYELGPDTRYACTFHWCAAGLAPLPEALTRVSADVLLPDRTQFDGDGRRLLGVDGDLFDCTGTFPPTGDAGVRIQHLICSTDRLFGLLGFDRPAGNDGLSGKDLGTLQLVSQMLKLFLTEKHSVHLLAESGVLFQALSDCLRSCTYIIDPERYTLVFVNQNTRQVIPAAQPGTLCYETVRGRSAPCDDCPITRMRRDGVREFQTEMYLDRYQLWAKINASLLPLADGREYGLFNGYDFAEYKKKNGNFLVDVDAFTQDTTLYDALTLSTDDYIYMCDMPKNLFYFPQAMVEEFGLPGQIIEDAIPVWGSYLHEEDREVFFQQIDDMVQGKTDAHNQEYRARNKDGQWVWLRCRGTLKHDELGRPTLFAGVITNLGKKSKIDPLCGLPNKYEFEVQTRARLADFPEGGGALLLLGLDNFKYINNLYGWNFGDLVLKDVAQQFQSFLPPKTHIYRLDGDSFGILFLGTDGAKQAEVYYNQVYTRFQLPCQTGSHRYYCTISGGCVVFQSAAHSFTALFKQAEYALEFAKSEGKNKLSFYDEDRMSGKERTLALIERLRDSVERNCDGFELYFQPQVAASTREVQSAEALLRWHCSEFGIIPPTQFIPLLEQSGLINKVGRWVLLTAMDAARAWRVEKPDFTVNVNLSFIQLQDKTFLPYLSELVAAGQLEPAALHLELTESCIAAGSTSLIEAFHTLRKMGFRIEMDDFGTGYSSLEILKNAPADVVKIDHAFVVDITRSDFDATFIRFVVSLCHSAGIKVCLEGVETWAEYHLVEPMELDLIQGYLFGRPQPRQDFERNYLNLPPAP